MHLLWDIETQISISLSTLETRFQPSPEGALSSVTPQWDLEEYEREGISSQSGWETWGRVPEVFFQLKYIPSLLGFLCHHTLWHRGWPKLSVGLRQDSMPSS